MLATCLLVALLSFNGEQIATTDEGKRVVLLDNGTWKEASQEEVTKYLSEKRVTLVDIIKNNSTNDFRKVRWGMSKAEVKSLEQSKLLSENADQIEYEVDFMGYACKVIYKFIKGKLQQADMLISQEHADPAKYYKDYEDLNGYLIPVYGRPVTDIKDWKNEMYKNDRSRWGFAISIGFLTCKTVWNNKRSQVSLYISGSNHKIATNLEYLGIESD